MTNDSQKLAKFFSIGGIILVLLLLLGALAYYGFNFLKNTASKTPAQNVAISIPEGSGNVFVNDVSGVQAADSKSSIPASVSQSENYTLKEITFGGYEVDMSGEAKNTPLIISDVKGETMVSKDGQETRLLFSWKTNKLATSQVTYAKNDGPIKNTLDEQGPGLSHALILNFEPATRYTYSIKATDRWGNTATSDKFSAYTSTKTGNIVDLIAQQFKQIFSWTGMK
jgi:hypothetical protein